MTRAATWYVLQASIAQLVSIFATPEQDGNHQRASDITSAVRALASLSHLNPTIKRTHDVISTIFQASQTEPATDRVNTHLEGQDLAPLTNEQLWSGNFNDGSWAWLLDDLEPSFEQFLGQL